MLALFVRLHAISYWKILQDQIHRDRALISEFLLPMKLVIILIAAMMLQALHLSWRQLYRILKPGVQLVSHLQMHMWVAELAYLLVVLRAQQERIL